jgi:signal transduction histidine kinase
MTGSILSGFLLLLTGITCLTVAILLFRYQKFINPTTNGVLSILILLWLWSWMQSRYSFSNNASYHKEWLEPVSYYGIFILSAISIFTFRRAFDFKVDWRRWGIYTIFCTLFIIAIERITPIVFSSRTPAGLILCSGWVGSIVYMGLHLPGALALLQKSRQRNRFFIWLYAWVLLNLGTLLIMGQLEVVGFLMLGLGAITAAFITQSLSPPEIEVFNRQILRWFLLTVPMTFIGWLGFYLMKFIESLSPGWGIITTSLIIASILAGCLISFWNRLPQILNRIIPIPTYDMNRILQEYSHGISRITDPHILSSVAVGLISEAIEIQRGYIFEVGYEATPEGGVYHLSEIGGMGRDKPEEIWLPVHNKITTIFQKERRILTMEELLTSPEFTQHTDTAPNWMTRLGMEVYLPIHSKDEWIGVMGLGPKKSHMAYTEDDLVLVKTLADQMGLALFNARLLESLMRVNNDFRRAYTSMEQSNRNLQQAVSQLEKIDQTKSDFISIASHELRTPLTVMRGYNDLLLDEPSFKENPTYGKYLQGIHKGILRLHEILESMLDMANIDARSLTLHKTQVSIPMLTGQIQDEFSQTLKERHLAFECEGLSNLQMIEADPEALIKVFKNLVGNAIKFTPDGGTISITGVPVSVQKENQAESNIEIIISDTGVGIKPELLETIFTKFYQSGDLSLHSSGKMKYKGSGPGLGLAIAKGIIEAHGGRIWCESSGYDETSCPGSHFHIILPVKQEA